MLPLLPELAEGEGQPPIFRTETGFYTNQFLRARGRPERPRSRLVASV